MEEIINLRIGYEGFELKSKGLSLKLKNKLGGERSEERR